MCRRLSKDVIWNGRSREKQTCGNKEDCFSPEIFADEAWFSELWRCQGVEVMLSICGCIHPGFDHCHHRLMPTFDWFATVQHVEECLEKAQSGPKEIKRIPLATSRDPLDHNSVSGLHLRSQGVAKCELPNYIDTQPLAAGRHIDRLPVAARTEQLEEEGVDLLLHIWFEDAH